MRDRYDLQKSAHPADITEPLFSQNGTNFGLVMDLTNGIVRLAAGSFCQSPFVDSPSTI